MKTSNNVFRLIVFQMEGQIDIIYFLMVLKCIHLINNSYWATEPPIDILSLFTLFFPFYCFLQSLKFFSNFLVLYFNADSSFPLNVTPFITYPLCFLDPTRSEIVMKKQNMTRGELNTSTLCFVSRFCSLH